MAHLVYYEILVGHGCELTKERFGAADAVSATLF
jgi:hypothetical protein